MHKSMHAPQLWCIVTVHTKECVHAPCDPTLHVQYPAAIVHVHAHPGCVAVGRWPRPVDDEDHDENGGQQEIRSRKVSLHKKTHDYRTTQMYHFELQHCFQEHSCLFIASFIAHCLQCMLILFPCPLHTSLFPVCVQIIFVRQAYISCSLPTIEHQT